MDDASALIDDSSSGAAADSGCPRCGEPPSALPPLFPSLARGEPLRRCARCGTRFTSGRATRRLVFTCSTCGLPFLSDELLPHSSQRCADCAAGKPPSELPDARVTPAIERELRLALESQWNFVGAPALSAYLDGIARQLARRIDDAPQSPRVVLFEEARLRTLALPSGTLLVSLGTLLFLEDEAELAFVLAHELTHAACADAAVRMVRLGFDAMLAANPGAVEPGWARGANDLIALGYGRHRERDADVRAFEAVLALGYDAQSVVRYLQRLEAAIERGDPRVAELALGHPPPGDRRRRVERVHFARSVAATGGRVNREVFRRAAGHAVLSTRLVRVHGLGEVAERPEAATTTGAPWRRVLAWIAGAALVAAAVGVGWWLLGA